MYLAGHSAGAQLAVMALLAAQSSFHLVKRKHVAVLHILKACD